MSNSKSRKLKKVRAQLHEKNNLIKLYRDRATDPNALVDYVQGLAALGQYALEVMVNQSPERSIIVWEALRAWGMTNGMLTTIDGKLAITKVYERANETPEPAGEVAQAD